MRLMNTNSDEFEEYIENFKQNVCKYCSKFDFCKGVIQRSLEIWEEDREINTKCENFVGLQ